MIITISMNRENLESGLRIQNIKSSRESDFIFGPDIQQCMSPDFDRNRPFHIISRRTTREI